MLPEKTTTALKWIVQLLEGKGIPYVISGGFAVRAYGGNRPVNDIDIDVPEDRLPEILKEVAEYITSPLQHFNDGKWDMQLMTLVYQGQEIDIGGGFETKLSNKERTDWVPVPTDFTLAKKIVIEGIPVMLADPERIRAYKMHLDGEHQLEDIRTLENYIVKQKDYVISQ